MDRRLKLQEILEQTLMSKNVYFQPPPSVKMKYPCIVYSRSRGDEHYGDNVKYINHKMYEVIFIARNPDNPLRERIEELPMCSFERHYTSDGLHHDVYSIYY